MPNVQLSFRFTHASEVYRDYITRSQDVFPKHAVDAILNGQHLAGPDLFDAASSQYHPDRDLC